MGYFLVSLSKSAATDWLDASEILLLVFAVVVVIGVVGEHRCGWPHPKAELFTILVAIGCGGELMADGGVFVFSRQLQTISDQEAKEAVTRSGEAKTSADEAAKAAERAKAASDGAIKSAAEAERRIAGVNQLAKEIDAELTYIERIISARRIQNVYGLTNELNKKYKGRQILLMSYTGDWEGYWLCSQLSEIAKKAEMFPQDECGNEALKNFPLTDIDVRAPTIPEVQDLSMLLMHEKRVPGMQCNLHVDPVLTIRVGVKAPPPILWPPHKRTGDPKAPAKSTPMKH
jgi:hypothetical protein